MNNKVYLAAIIGGVVAANIFLAIRNRIKIERMTDDMMHTYHQLYRPRIR